MTPLRRFGENPKSRLYNIAHYVRIASRDRDRSCASNLKRRRRLWEKAARPCLSGALNFVPVTGGEYAVPTWKRPDETMR